MNTNLDRYIGQYLEQELYDNSDTVNELLRTLQGMEEEYNRTKSPALKKEMMETAEYINTLLANPHKQCILSTER